VNWNNVLIIYKKEVLSFFKNKEALLVMLLVPLIIYPGIMLVTGDLVAGQLTKKSKAILNLDIVDVSDNDSIDKNLIGLQTFLQDRYKEELNVRKVTFSIKVQQTYKSKKTPSLKEKSEILLSFTKPSNPTAQSFGDINIYYDSRDDISSVAVNEIEIAIEDYNSTLLNDELIKRNISLDIINLFHIQDFHNIAPKGHTLVKYGSSLIAITLIFLVFVSCQYAATEVLPAEREQNTLETLLATPLEWKEIIVGKYFAIVSAGILNAFSNLTGIVLFGGSIIASIDQQSYGSDLLTFTPLKVFTLLLTLIPLALMCGSLALLLVSFAKTRMAASYYSLPGMLLVSIPAAISLLPNTELTGIWYSIPFANITLYFRNLFLGNITVFSTIIIFINIIGFSGILALCSIFVSHRKDQVLAGGANFSLFYRPKTEKGSLSLSEGTFIALISFILFTTIGMVLQTKMEPWSIALSFWGFLFVPSLLYMKFKRVNPMDFLKLYLPTATQIIGILISLIPILALAFIFQMIFNTMVPENTQSSEMMQNLILNFNNQYGIFICIFIFAITPGVTEEFIFRGVLFSSLKNKYSWILVILITGIIFAFIHGINRAIPILPVGIFLGWLRYRTQSIFSVIFFHICFNSIAVLQTIFSNEIQSKINGIAPNLEINDIKVLIPLVLFISLTGPLAYFCITKSQHKYFNQDEL